MGANALAGLTEKGSSVNEAMELISKREKSYRRNWLGVRYAPLPTWV
jgi:hypothetical protein